MKHSLRCLAALLLLSYASAERPDGLYAEIRSSKGLIVARLEMDLTPMTVANFVGLAEGTKAWKNPATHVEVHGKKFYDGLSFRRVIPDFSNASYTDRWLSAAV